MTHAALTPLLGREFDSFLCAAIDDDRNVPLLSVVSALARLDVDPWREAAELARMPKERAIERLASLIGSLPRDLAASRASAARLVALLPSSPAPPTLREIASARRTLFFIGLSVLGVLLAAFFAFTAHAKNLAPAPRAPSIAEQHSPASFEAPNRNDR